MSRRRRRSCRSCAGCSASMARRSSSSRMTSGSRPMSATRSRSSMRARSWSAARRASVARAAPSLYAGAAGGQSAARRYALPARHAAGPDAGPRGARRLPGCRFAPRCPTAIPPAATRRHRFAKSRPATMCAARRPAAALLPRPCRAPRRAGADGRGSGPRRRAAAKHYPGRRDWLGRRAPGVDAVLSASLSVRPGEFVGIVGESGSGKSTLARSSWGSKRRTSGRILVDGQDVSARAPRPGRSGSARCRWCSRTRNRRSIPAAR